MSKGSKEGMDLPYATPAIGAPSLAPGSGRLCLGQAAIGLIEPIPEVRAGHGGRIQAPSRQPTAPHVDNRVFTAWRKRVAVSKPPRALGGDLAFSPTESSNAHAA